MQVCVQVWGEPVDGGPGPPRHHLHLPHRRRGLHPLGHRLRPPRPHPARHGPNPPQPTPEVTRQASGLNMYRLFLFFFLHKKIIFILSFSCDLSIGNYKLIFSIFFNPS